MIIYLELFTSQGMKSNIRRYHQGGKFTVNKNILDVNINIMYNERK